MSVAAVVVGASGQILVARRRDNGQWEPPGGILEMEETPLDGLAREVHEETGLRIRPLRLTGVYKNMVRGVIALVFRAEVVSGTISTSDETSRVEWWTPEAVEQRMSPVYAVRVLDALRSDGPAVRAHDGVVPLHEIPTLPS